MRRTLYLSQPAYIRLQHSQLLLCLTNTGEEIIITLDNLGYLIVDHPQITLSQPLLRALGEANVALIVCDQKHHPLSLMLSLHHHHLTHHLTHAQIKAPLPLKKQLWKTIVKQKLHNQSRLLQYKGYTQEATYLHSLIPEVCSGDTTQREAIGARYYWRYIFGQPFIRNPKGGQKINAALNYGYAMLRAAVARALVQSGLLPIMGIYHHNQYNPYPLADDLMEPYRPFVDQHVRHLCLSLTDHEPLMSSERVYLLEIMTHPCSVKMGQSTLAQAIEETATSLARAFQEQNVKRLTYPLLPHQTSPHANHPTP